jgi:hypothetical protein
MQRKIVLVIGPSGAGKTETVSHLIDDIDRVAVFDIVRDDKYTTRKDVVVVEGAPAQFAREIGATKFAAGTEPKQKFKVIYHPLKAETDDNGLVDSPEFTMFVKVCRERLSEKPRSQMTIVIDEAHLICNSHNCPKELMDANLIGRHDEMSMILVAQRFTGVHPAIRENTDEFYFWKIIQPASLKSIAEYCGDDTAKQVSELRAVELDANNKFVKAGQRLHWTKFGGIVEVTE